MKRTVTFAVGKVPAEERALDASRGRCVRMMEDASVRGSCGEEARSGIEGSG